MKLKADFRFRYVVKNEKYSHEQRLELVVKYRFPKRLFRTKLVQTMESTKLVGRAYPDYDGFEKAIEITMNSHLQTIKEVEDMVIRDFRRKDNGELSKDKQKEIAKKVKQKGKHQIPVFIKQEGE